jgi:DNA mismatch repair protein MutL
VLYREPANICENEFQNTFAEEIPQNTPIFQWQNKYIILPSESGLMMVHQHRAHVAILYKELLLLLKKQQGMSQALLFPEILELTENDMQTLQAMQEDLQAIGFGLDQFSPNSYSVTAVPMQLGQNNPCETLLQVIHQVQDNGGTAAQQWQENMALALADKMAIPMGKTLSEMEMRDLLKRLMEQHPARFLNNGQTIITILTHEEIQKRF